jgi:DtxR family manganese transport transcriptional regulator
VARPKTPRPSAARHETAERHRVRREQHETEAAQDYCEAIAEFLDAGVEARVGRIAERFGLSHVTVSRVVRRLAAEGFVVAEPRKPLGLTLRGRALAAEARRRHELVLAFLLALGVDRRSAEVDAEGIEHHVTPATLRAMARHLGPGR